MAIKVVTEEDLQKEVDFLKDKLANDYYLDLTGRSVSIYLVRSYERILSRMSKDPCR